LIEQNDVTGYPYVIATDYHTASIILLHGLGDSAEGVCPIAEYWAQSLRHVKFIMPTARRRRIAIYAGEKMPAW
jgi:predicted esterase